MKKVLLFVLLSFTLIFVSAGTAQEMQNKSVQDSTGKKVKIKKSWMSVKNTLLFAPVQIENIQRFYKGWKKAMTDSVSTKRLKQPIQMLLNTMLMHDQQFLTSISGWEQDTTTVKETVEYYDDDVQLNIQWYLWFLSSDKWLDLYHRFDPHFLDKNLWNERIRNIEQLRAAETQMYSKLLSYAQNVPPKFRRKFRGRFMRYDEPPSPVEGFATIQQRMNQFNSHDFKFESDLILLNAFISEDGEVLRVKIQKSSGNAKLDSTATAVIRAASWQSAKFNGEPLKTDVIIPLRLWNGPTLKSDHTKN